MKIFEADFSCLAYVAAYMMSFGLKACAATHYNAAAAVRLLTTSKQKKLDLPPLLHPATPTPPRSHSKQATLATRQATVCSDPQTFTL